MQNLYDNLKELLQKDERLVVDGKLLKNKIIELALAMDASLLKLLLTDAAIKKHFFTDVSGVLVFDKIKFQKFISNKQFLPNSYTAFKNKIGLTVNDEYISESKDVVLAWPYKDCVLEGGQMKEKEEHNRNEIFWNETLAPDEIDQLLSPKVLTNFKKYDKSGEQNVTILDKVNNLIINGNNLFALHSLEKLYHGKIKLIYIDPPYNTGADSFQYNDSFNHSTWLAFMKNRLQIARKLLSKDGSIWINVDDNEIHYLKVICDEIFGRDNFLNTIIWQRAYSPVNMNKHFSANHDAICVYAKNISSLTLNRIPRTDVQNNRYKNPDEDKNGPWKPQDFSVGPAVEKNIYKITLPSGRIVLPPKGRSWLVNEDKYNELIKENKIWFGKEGNSVPSLKKYVYELKDGVIPLTLWTYDEVGHNQDAKKELKAFEFDVLFATPKPEKLINRIIHIGSNENDIVLDFFAGSGTTAAVSLKMNRKFIACEQMNYVKNITLERLKKVIDGEQGGISKSVNWQGGGSFVYCELAKANQQFIDEIQSAKSKVALQKIWAAMQQKAFISYNVDIASINDKASGFADLTLEEQQRFLIEILDKNMLYVPYSSIDDNDYNISDADKKLNKMFYEMGK